MIVRGSVGARITKCKFESNTAALHAGLGVEYQRDVEILDCVFRNNLATSTEGGGLSVLGSTKVSLLNTSFYSNMALTYGGGILLRNVRDIEMNETFVHGSIARRLGGGIFMEDCKNVLLLGGTISQNTAAIAGGGIYVKLVSGLQLKDYNVVANIARNESGGGLNAKSSEISVANTTFQLNLATSGGGGGVFWETITMNEPLWLRNSTNKYRGNVAEYGHSWATESYQVRILENSSDVEVDDYFSGQRIVAALHDFYGQFVPLNTTEDVLGLLHGDADSQECGDIAGHVTGDTVESFVEGVANFSEFEAFCVPGGTFGMRITHVSSAVGVTNRFSSVVNMKFRECVRGEYSIDRICVKCELGSYSFTTSSNVDDLPPSICQPCPDRAEWCAGDQISLKKGYWRIHEDSHEILTCPWSDRSCRGGTAVGNDLCAPGYEGALCAVCSDGYHYTRSTQSCEPCEEKSSWLDAYSSLVAVFFIGTTAAVAAYFFKSRVMDREKLSSLDDVLVYMAMRVHLVDAQLYSRNKEKLSVYMKENRRRFTTRARIYIAFYQIISVVPFVLDLEFPNVYTMVTAFLGALVNFNASTSTVVTCSFDSGFDFIDILYVDVTTPIVVVVLLKLIQVTHLHFKTKKWIRKKDPDLRNKQNRIRSYYFLTFLLYSYMFLPGLSATIFQTFSCVDIDSENVAGGDDWYLRADYSVSCETSRYSVAVVVASIAVIVYPVGIPAFYFYHLYSNCHTIQTREEPCETEEEEKQRLLQLRPLRMLFDVYKPKFWYWEVVETFYRLCLTGVLVLVNQGSSLQIIMGVLFSLLFIWIYELADPYEDSTLMRIKDIALWQIFFIFGCALLIDGNYIDSSNQLLVLFMIFVIFVNFLADVVRWLYLMVRDDGGGGRKRSRSRSSTMGVAMATMIRRASLRGDSCQDEAASTVDNVVISPLVGDSCEDKSSLGGAEETGSVPVTMIATVGKDEGAI